MNFIDTHCHLNDPAFTETLPDVIARANAAGVYAFVVPAYDVESLKRTAELASLYPDGVFPAYGLHPWYIADPVAFDLLRSYIVRKDAVAVGEIGLDFSPECPPAVVQVPAFTRQLDMAVEAGLPVLIHCRKAYDRLYEILKSYKGRIKGVLHSYSGGKDAMTRFIDLDFYISFSGSVTRPTARKYHKTAAAVPVDRFLLETDAPSIATESTVASQVEPRHVLEVAEKLAYLRSTPLAEVGRLSTKNALRLFNRIPKGAAT